MTFNMRTISLLLCLLLCISGCSQRTETAESLAGSTMPTRLDDSSACAYWKCSKERKLYMQKYVKREGSSYYPAGAFKLDQGVGAFPLTDLEEYGSDGSNVSIDIGFDPCPYCRSSSLGRCCCGKTLCLPESPNASGCFGASLRVTCPWCDRVGNYSASGAWGVGGGG